MDGLNINSAGSSAIGSNLHTAQAESAKDMPILREYGRLGAGLTNLEEVTEHLRTRLDNVLTPSMPNAVSEKGLAPVSQSKMADQIRSDADRIYVVCDRIGEILQRLEIDS